ncbi:NAD(P)-dependent dehydrogenase [Fructobacillus cardui]|nr:NAD(P)-dependent dehydrogenase [Fructobacillus cardui]
MTLSGQSGGQDESKSCHYHGTGHGIGAAIAKRLAQENFKVGVAEINQQTAEKTAAEINQNQVASAKAYVLDVAQCDQVFALLHQVVQDLGEIDVFVNNAGVAYIETIVDSDPKEVERLFDVNLKGTYWGIQAAASQFQLQGHGGKIINAASLASGRLCPARCLFGFKVCNSRTWSIGGEGINQGSYHG